MLGIYPLMFAAGASWWESRARSWAIYALGALIDLVGVQPEARHQRVDDVLGRKAVVALPAADGCRRPIDRCCELSHRQMSPEARLTDDLAKASRHGLRISQTAKSVVDRSPVRPCRAPLS